MLRIFGNLDISFLNILTFYSKLTFFTNIFSSIFLYSYIFFSTLPFTSFCFQIVLTQAFSILEKSLVFNFVRATCVFFTFSSCFVGTHFIRLPQNFTPLELRMKRKHLQFPASSHRCSQAFASGKAGVDSRRHEYTSC